MDLRKAIEALLSRTIGLQVDSIGADALDRAVRRRMAACGLPEMGDYLRLIKTSPEELNELCELVVVPETWFFRDIEPFAFLKHYVMSDWLCGHKSQVLRILSIPCSTGEEPYSAAMALLDSGIHRDRFTIDAVDISHRALSEAGKGLYGRNSFRGEDLSYRERFFRPEGNRYRLQSAVKERVRFLWGNLSDPSFLADHQPYHIIFCRNLLIYFDAEARERAMRSLDRLLERSGLLFLGHTEILLAPSPPFSPVSHPRAFAVIRSSGESANSSREAPSLPPRKPAMEKLDIRAKTVRVVPPVAYSRGAADLSRAAVDSAETEPKTSRSSQRTMPVLDEAAALADLGRIAEARQLCEQALEEYGATDRGFLLLGLIHESSGNVDKAEECFNKAVYLNPRYHEALVHLALLSERRGDANGAAIFRQRARRVGAHLKKGG